MSDLLVICGAGASYDALREGDERPPLANELFDTKYDEIQRSFPGVDGLRDTIRARMAQGQGLEQVLGVLSENRNLDIRRQILEVPVYLSKLLSQFSTGRAGTYDALITPIQENGLSAMFATLNYDDLLDLAIERKYGLSIGSLGAYVDSERWKLVKLHGSVRWGHPTRTQRPPDIFENVWTHLSEREVSSDVVDYRKILHLSRQDTETADDGTLIYPALAMPTDRKNETVCPDEHVEALRAALQSDPAVLVIGNQGLDTDLMRIIEESAQRGSIRPIHIVDHGSAFRVAWRFAKALGRLGWRERITWPLNYPGRSVGEATVTWSNSGFRQFVESEDARRFFAMV